MCVEIKIDDSKKINVPLKKDVSADARELENVLPELKQALVGTLLIKAFGILNLQAIVWLRLIIIGMFILKISVLFLIISF